ncbi:MAG: class I tRNA ligase family protein, partial [Chthoniobacterales bacterium]|nr:class I tRNA ligase family protein [Chthoniobacterales bacterium]
ALEAIESVEWLPSWGKNRIRGTVEARPDWCISRQRTWGVPLPAFHLPDGSLRLDANLIRSVAEIVRQKGTDVWFDWDDEQWNQTLNLPSGTTRSLDTLDVWIDSGVSHQAVLCNHDQLAFPADLYLEATDQHRGWFQSSLMTSIALGLQAPYRKVLTHGFVVDVDTRKKISKSEQAGYQKPTEASHYVEKYGADLVRLWVCSVNFTDDVPFSEEIFTRLSDAYRRIRNTLRILLGNLHSFDYSTMSIPFPERTEVDRWVLSEAARICKICKTAYENLEFYKVYQELTQFCAVELSSLYIDITKDRLYCDHFQSPRRLAACSTMYELFDVLCRLLAPILAFTAEEAWGYFRPGTSVHL